MKEKAKKALRLLTGPITGQTRQRRRRCLAVRAELNDQRGQE